MDLEIIIKEESEGLFTAKCINFDVMTQGNSREQAKQRMKDQLVEEGKQCFKSGYEMLVKVLNSPQDIEGIWETVKADCFYEKYV